MTSDAVTACADCDGRGWTLRDARIQPCDCGTYDPPKWVTRGDTPCLAPHYKDPDRPRRAHIGYVCAGHHAKLERMFAELPALHDALGLMLTASERPGECGRTKHGQVSGGVTLNSKVIDARAEIHAELVRMIRDYTDRRREPLPTADTIPALATWLVVRADWIAGQLDADDTLANLDRLTRWCRTLAYPSGEHRIRIGPCADDGNDGGCPGTLWLTGATDETRTMACDYCARDVHPRYWRRERRRIDGVDANPWLTLTEAAVQYGTTTRTIERLVAKGKLHARGAPMRVKASAVEALITELATRACA